MCDELSGGRGAGMWGVGRWEGVVCGLAVRYTLSSVAGVAAVEYSRIGLPMLCNVNIKIFFSSIRLSMLCSCRVRNTHQTMAHSPLFLIIIRPSSCCTTY